MTVTVYSGRRVGFPAFHPDVVFYGRRVRLNTSSLIRKKRPQEEGNDQQK